MGTPTESFLHPALFYRDSDSYLAGTVPFVEAGLDAGEAVAVAVPGSRLALLESALGAAAGRVRLIDMEQAGRNPGRIIPRILRAFVDAHAGTRVRIVGEPIWAGRSAAEYAACAQHEALVNHAFTGREATVLCPFDISRLDRQVLDDALATHPMIIEDDVPRSSPGYAPDTVVDAYNQPFSRPSGSPARGFDAMLLPDTRAFAVREAVALGLPADRCEDLALVVAELTTNSVIHGGGTGTLHIWAEGGDIVCEVEDAGHIADPLAGRHIPPPGRPGGRGLLLVNYLTDLVRIHTTPTGTAVRCHLRLSPPPPSPAPDADATAGRLR
ncbi:sensor histidine kinase [Streptomyces sp. NBC_01198]|uniref:sensor histidine kinase n=1 Tax=Streptomyces sp. NBC_01198 TaxID=2903769 RepID=UPI002E1522AC|nr:sensor histidine kinase [Streptomyces sp. NBC_01198]